LDGWTSVVLRFRDYGRLKVEVGEGVFDFGYLIVEKIAHAKDGKDVAMVQTTFNRRSTPWSTP
jgi:hypothetical protein